MKRTMLAILALSPVLLHAQSKSPAQPESTPVLQSTNIQPLFLAAGNGAAAVTASTPRRISTSIVPPVLVYQAVLTPSPLVSVDFSRNRNLSIAFLVDKDGKPTELKVVKSAGEIIDNQVLAAVREYRYKPATLNGEPVAMEVNLNVQVQ